MTAILHGSVLQIVCLIVFFALLKATAANVDQLEQMLRQAIVDALHSAHLSIQESAFAQGICERQWRKQLAGEDHHQISLTKLIRLPFSFWLWFGPALMTVIYRKRLQEFAECVTDIKRGA